jgi:polyisoprenoid-binding protein YceI
MAWTHSRRSVSIFAIGLLAAAEAFGATEVFQFNTQHSHVGFPIRHLVSRVDGRFKDFGGTIEIDRHNPSASRVEVTIQTASVDTADENRDKHLRSSEFFDVERFPTITFKSTKIEARGADSYEVTGDLTMKGVTKTARLAVKSGGFLRTSGAEKAGFEVTGTVDRKAFGVSWNRAIEGGGMMLSDDVAINIQVEADKPDPTGVAQVRSGGVAGAAACGPTDINGLFKGTSKSGDTQNDVMLNLLCSDGQYVAQLFTSSGDFVVTEAAPASDHLTLKFDTYAALGSADLTLRGDSLSGSTDVAGDKGTVTLTRAGPALAANALTPAFDLTPAQWHEDLRFLASELPKRHANAFFSLSRSAFDSEIASLDQRLDTSNADQIFVGLQQIIKTIGDGHTGLGTPPPDRRVMPLQFAKFAGDFRVAGVGPGYDAALGARLVRVGDVPVAEAWRRVLTLTAQAELMELRQEDALVYLARGYALHGLDITPDRNHTIYTLRDDAGHVFTIDVKGLKPGETVPMRSGYFDLALRYQKRGAPFWCKSLSDGQALYCGWRAYQDLAANAKAMFDQIALTQPRKLIIDMRDNGGGDNTVGYSELVQRIKARADLNRKGRLYVLIGPQTFSAAMNNAAQFQDETNAILVGQTIGEKPNSYQEPRQFRLPNSHLVVRASTLYYEFRKNGENAVRPSTEIIPSWADVKAGRDPVMEWVLARPVK